MVEKILDNREYKENFDKFPNNNFSLNSNRNQLIFPLLGRKIFKIKKYTKYNKYLSEICTDSDVTDEEKNKLKDPQVKKISPFSKVNFSKLKNEEKDERLKNLAKLVKRLRRKVRNLENKVRFNASKLLNKYVWTKLGINTKNKYVTPEFSFDFDKICRALKRVRNHEDFEFSDQKHLIENLINMIAEGKLKLDSFAYKRICSQVRMLLKNEQIKYISKNNSKVTISFPEREINISHAEYNKLKKYKNKEEILRAILGVYDQEEKTIKISIEKNENEILREKDLNKKFNHQEILSDKNLNTKIFINNEKNLNLFQNFRHNKPYNSNILSINSTNNENMTSLTNNQINENNNINSQLSSNNVFENFDYNILENYLKCNNLNLNNTKNQILLDQENLGNFQNNFYRLSNDNKIKLDSLSQEAFQYNNTLQNHNLVTLNCFNSLNNIPNYINPLQIQMMHFNNNQSNLNQNPQIMNSLLFNQNISQLSNQNKNTNIFNQYANCNNNNYMKSPSKNNLFLKNKINFSDNNTNTNLFGGQDKNNNSSYNVFIK